MDKKIIGIDLGGTSIKFGIITEAGEVQQKWSISTNILDEGSHIVPDIIESIQHHLDLYQLTAADFYGIGMGSPGAVDREAGTVIGAFNLNWKSLQKVKAPIESALGIPFYIDNDANVAALGEKWMGAGGDNNDVVFVTLGTGVGGGIIADGNLIRGTAGSGGEIGHITVDTEHGYPCTCGKDGCLETVASATGILNLTRQYAEEYAGEAALKRMIDAGEEVTSKIVFDLAKENDPLALKVVEKFAYYLGLACSHIGNLLNPAYIVIGGGVSAAGDFLLTRTQNYFEKFTFPNVRQTTRLKLAQLGNSAGIIGAAHLVIMEQKKIPAK